MSNEALARVGGGGSTEIAVSYERSVEDLIAQADKIKLAMKKAMEHGTHYGTIPGVNKPTLYKAGAEKLNLLFRMDPQYDSDPIAPDLGGGGHLTIKSICTLWHIPTGQRLGSGEAMCSTREAKYGYRETRRVCPACGKDAIIKGRAEYGGGWVCFKKRDGCGAKYKDGDAAIESQVVGRIPNPDLPDAYNTVQKMANKRALVAAVLNVTAASDVFTQDVEDAHHGDESDAPNSPPRQEEEPARNEVESERPAKRPAGPAMGIVVGNFGPQKGAEVSALNDKALAFYLKTYTEDVSNPAKENWRARNMKILNALDAEATRRANAQGTVVDLGGPAESDEPPF
jgi:hypothetical protein